MGPLVSREQMDPSKCELYRLYEQKTTEIISKTDEYTAYKDTTKLTHKSYKNRKAFWTGNLSLTWKGIS